MITRILIAALGISLLCAPAAWSGPGGKKKGIHGVHGKVVAVEKDKDKDVGYIVIRTGKKGATPGEERKFYITEGTKFEKVTVVKGQKPDREPASFKNVHRGEHVVIKPSDDQKDRALGVAIVLRTK